jgi:CHAD domain-containing protein
MFVPMQQVERLIEFTEKQLARLDKHFDSVQEQGDVDAVHDFRVASRRLQEPLAIIANWTPRRRVERVQRRLKRLRRALAHTRDLDVLFLSFGDAQTAPPLEAVDREHLEQLLNDQRRHVLARARNDLLERKPRKVQQQVPELIEVFRHRSAGEHASVVAATVAQWRQRAGDVLGQRPVDDANTDLHACRIALKRLRYSTELLRRMEGEERGSFIDSLVSMQDLLGAWNDHLFASAELARMATREKLLSRRAGLSAAVLKAAAARATLAEAMRREALADWPTLQAAVEAESARSPQPAVA